MTSPIDPTIAAEQARIDALLGIDPAQRAANSVVQANAVMAIYGMSGGGKSSLADTGAEYVHEKFGGTALCYALDPGGFGNKRLALIRAGLMSVWDPTNHVRPFETLELIAMGAWPEEILDPERGYADPEVKLVLPRRVEFVLTCPNGHPVVRKATEAEVMLVALPCPTCGVVTSYANTQGVQTVLVKSKLFHNVGLRIYDSFTAMCDRGLLELPKMSARGELAVSGSGGSVLGSADAFTQGTVTYGTGSKAQVGFVQNLAYRWLLNMRAIPDQKLPPICTFGVEQSKSDDESGGEILLGLKLAGVARTGAACGWVGNLLHASKEPDDLNRMRHRLWLTNHIDPRDPRRIPYVAKHRGTPLGMPDFLEDPWSDDAAERARAAWTVCSLPHFYKLLDQQFEEEVRALVARHPNAPVLKGATAAAAEDEVEVLAAPQVIAASSGGAASSRRRGRVVEVPAPPVAAAATAGAPVAPSPTAPSPIVEQLQATLAAAGVVPATQPTAAAPAAAPAADTTMGDPIPGPTGPSAAPAPRRRTPRPPV